jgi:transcriptional regulator with XRE-family HTH domain
MLGVRSTASFCIASFVSVESARKAICSQVARILREERLKQRLSMTALAERAGLSQQSVSYVEREMRIPNLDTLLRITSVLEVDLEKIIARARKLAATQAR